MSELAGRSYIPKLYRIDTSRGGIIQVLLGGIEAGGARVVSCSFPEQLVAPVYIGAEDPEGRRYGLLVYPFTTTRRPTRHRPVGENRFQIRYGDPVRVRAEANPLAYDPAGVDVTLVVAVDPEREVVVGLDPLVYAELPIGVSGYYNDHNAAAITATGWIGWAKEKTRSRAALGGRWDGLECMIGIRPDRLLDYARFEALATSLGLETGLRLKLADEFATGTVGRHELERLFGLDAATILDIVESNFRLGVAVRGSVAEHHLGITLTGDPVVASATPIDQDGQPDFLVKLRDGRAVTVECKNALRETYKSGDAKVETQKTRDSGAGRKYRFDAFDVTAACMFSVTGRWTFKFKRARDLAAWSEDSNRIAAIQRVDDSWVDSFGELMGLIDPEVEGDA